jgi:hypothetical protein
MNDVQFKKFMKELSDIKNLLILSASKPKVTSDDIGKCLGVGSSRIRNILAGASKKRKTRGHQK